MSPWPGVNLAASARSHARRVWRVTSYVRSQLVNSERFSKAKMPTGKPRQAWVWNALDGIWQRLSEGELRPGLTLLLDATAGGYDKRCGWDESSRQAVDIVPKDRNRTG